MNNLSVNKSLSPDSQMDGRGLSGYLGPNPMRFKVGLILILLVVHVLITLFFTVPGYLSIDEAIYHFMAKNFSQTWGLEIWNGYGEFPSPELSSRFLTPRDGRLVAQYPYLFPVVALPLYRVMGFAGLFVLNAISFMGVVALCFAIAKKLFHDVDLALNACLILVLATFAWEYSQAAWPHVTATLFITSAFFLVVCAYLSKDTRRALWLAACAGLVAGFAPGVRMDAILAFPALIIPFLFGRPSRFAEALMLVMGMVPGLGVLAFTNFKKFGHLTPFSYGGGTDVPVYTTVAALVLLFSAWVFTRPAFVDRVRINKIKIFLAALVALGLLVSIPETRGQLSYMVGNIYASVIEIRSVDPNYAMPAARRTAGGGVVYLGAHKKALLQSLPFLAILVIPLARTIRGGKDFFGTGILWLVPISVLGFYSYNPHEYGGLCLNYRYFVIFLPFLAVLSAYAIRELDSQWGFPFGWRAVLLISSLTVAAYLLLTKELTIDLESMEFTLLVVPLLLAGIFLVFLVAGSLLKSEGVNILRSAAWGVLIIAMTWSGAVAFFYDYPKHRAQRAMNYSIGGQALQVVPPDSIIFTAPYIDPFMRLIEQDRVRIALPAQDNFADFPKIVEFYLNKGKRVFAVFPDKFWTSLKEGSLAKYALTPVLQFPGSYMAEISLKPEARKAPENQ